MSVTSSYGWHPSGAVRVEEATVEEVRVPTCGDHARFRLTLRDSEENKLDLAVFMDACAAESFRAALVGALSARAALAASDHRP